MSKVNLAISGCMGRMGQQLIKSSRVDKNFKLTTLTENRLIKKKISGIKPSLNNQNSFKNVDLIIDFTVPNCTFEILKIASKLKKRVVIGTTGFTKKEESLIKKFSKKIPILKAGNMSLGINLLMYLTEIASRSLGNTFLSKVYLIRLPNSEKEYFAKFLDKKFLNEFQRTTKKLNLDYDLNFKILENDGAINLSKIINNKAYMLNKKKTSQKM